MLDKDCIQIWVKQLGILVNKITPPIAKKIINSIQFFFSNIRWNDSNFENFLAYIVSQIGSHNRFEKIVQELTHRYFNRLIFQKISFDSIRKSETKVERPSIDYRSELIIKRISGGTPFVLHTFVVKLRKEAKYLIWKYLNGELN